MATSPREVLLSGPTSALFTAVSRRFLEDGFRVTAAGPDPVQSLLEELRERGKSPDTLVHFAAPLEAMGFDAVGPALGGLHGLLRTAALHMRPAGFGRIVVVGASERLQPQAAGVAAWAGTCGLVRDLAHEVGPWGVTVNAIACGAPPAPGPLTPGAPLARPGSFDEVAGLVRMLCAVEAGYVHGQCLGIHGG